MLYQIKKFIPKPLFDALAPIYHYLLALTGAIIYRFPSRHLIVIGVTGTKGKSSTTEMLNAIFEAAGYKTAILGTIRFKVGDNSRPNKLKMTMPGRFFVHKFLREAVIDGCEIAILEISSEAAKQSRHRFIGLDGLIFTNLSPEHIESHGSFEKYRAAKLSIAKTLGRRLKERSVIVANAEDPAADLFLNAGAEEKYPYSLDSAKPFTITSEGICFTYKNTEIRSPLRGLFNLYNMLGAAVMAEAFAVSVMSIKEGLERLSLIKGRVEFVKVMGEEFKDQTFDVVVDYAHTSNSLTELYKTFADQRKICVLGNTGGGRDKWKRPEMAGVADSYCDEIILTNEDPYDEDPNKILEDMLPGIVNHQPKIIMDRREAIREAVSKANPGDAVLISGKGTDPYIMLANNKKLPWSDYEVAKEELGKLLSK